MRGPVEIEGHLRKEEDLLVPGPEIGVGNGPSWQPWFRFICVNAKKLEHVLKMEKRL